MSEVLRLALRLQRAEEKQEARIKKAYCTNIMKTADKQMTKDIAAVLQRYQKGGAPGTTGKMSKK